MILSGQVQPITPAQFPAGERDKKNLVSLLSQSLSDERRQPPASASSPGQDIDFHGIPYRGCFSTEPVTCHRLAGMNPAIHPLRRRFQQSHDREGNRHDGQKNEQRYLDSRFSGGHQYAYELYKNNAPGFSTGGIIGLIRPIIDAWYAVISCTISYSQNLAEALH